MGILNVTPDSFSDGGRHDCLSSALQRAEVMIQEGADIIDVGGESTRPGASVVPVQQEMDRVMPVLEHLRHCGVPLSIDTRKAVVMRAAISAQVDMVNDISALQDPGAMSAVASSQAAVCLMHMHGVPATMQQQAAYVDVVSEVAAYLAGRIELTLSAGIERSRIVIDPGFGFGKTLTHNIELLRYLSVFTGIGSPVLVGLSRKSMLGLLTGAAVDQRVYASIAAAMLAIQRGAAIVRVHDVRATKDAIKVMEAVGQ